MNASDGGKNRPNMRLIGVHGLRTVLTAMGQNINGMLVEDMQKLLWECSIVQEQLTTLERLCRERGVILIYNPKSPPRFSPCEVLPLPAPFFLIKYH